MSAPIQVTRVSYHGWQDCFRIRNGIVEATIVPAVGRIMQFQFADGAPILWENGEWFGKLPDPASQQWQNFGGDKSWPSPQADWLKITGREWPPPAAFDSMPDQAEVEGQAVVLISPVDTNFGIRERRRVELEPNSAVMRITTTYEKVQGAPMKVGIGVITQLPSPERAFMKLNPHSRFPQGYKHMMFGAPHDIKVEDGLVSLVRGQSDESQIGSDSDSLVWVGAKDTLLIHSPHVKSADYPNDGCSAVIFTSKDPYAYVELETFEPLSLLKPGDYIERTNTYTLLHRKEADPYREAKRALSER